MELTVDKAIALGIFFLMLGALVFPFWGTAIEAATNVTGLNVIAIGAILLAIFVYYVFH